MTTVLEDAKRKYHLDGEKMIKKVFEIKKNDTTTSIVIQKLKWMAVRKRKLNETESIGVKQIKQSEDEVVDHGDIEINGSKEIPLLLPTQDVSTIVEADDIESGNVVVSVKELAAATEEEEEEEESTAESLTHQSDDSSTSSMSSSNSTMSVIQYETEVRQADRPIIDQTNRRSQDERSSANIFTISPDRKEDSFVISRLRKPEEVKKCINLSVLEWRYVFIDRIEGTPFFYCFDMKDLQQFYCKVSNHSCTKLIEAYNRLKNQANINQLHKVIRLDKKTYLLFPRPQDDMLSYLRNKKSLPEEEARFLFRQMCDIVRSCHEKGVVLRDLKLRKFVFDDSEKTHIQLESLVDAVVLKDPENDLIQEKRGCPLYVAPEVLKTSRPYNGKSADMWSLGVILYTMLLGRYPFNEEEHSHLFMKITNGKFFIPNNISPKARCLIRSLLQQDPQSRLTSEDVFYHPWMTANNIEVYDLIKTDHCVPVNDFDKK